MRGIYGAASRSDDDGGMTMTAKGAHFHGFSAGQTDGIDHGLINQIPGAGIDSGPMRNLDEIDV